jgi:flagellum-specific peptidoglycan hydrolase FlgJ
MMIKLIIFMYILPPSVSSVKMEIEQSSLTNKEIVLSQAILETGWFKSYSCRVRNNLFGLTKPTGGYFEFTHWAESIRGYKTMIQYRLRKGEEYYEFLKRIGYASDTSYARKVKQIVIKINK